MLQLWKPDDEPSKDEWIHYNMYIETKTLMADEIQTFLTAVNNSFTDVAYFQLHVHYRKQC